MSTEASWAAAVILADYMDREASGIPDLEDPLQALQTITDNTFAASAPRERYSTELVALPKSSEDFLPIDGLYGQYSPLTREVIIYTAAIDRDKHLYGASFEELLHIVRLHEYAHALLHLGIRGRHLREHLGRNVDKSDGGWSDFFQSRAQRYQILDEGSHEFIAQALALACVRQIQAPAGNRLVDVFSRLEAR